MTRELAPCGTPAAYRRHLRHGEAPCEACKQAEYDRKHPGRVPRQPSRHGTTSKYGSGCRCEQCTAAQREYARYWRDAVAGLPAVFVPHGVGGYRNYGCRCQVCTAANTEAYQAYLERRAADAATRSG